MKIVKNHHNLYNLIFTKTKSNNKLYQRGTWSCAKLRFKIYCSRVHKRLILCPDQSTCAHQNVLPPSEFPYHTHQTFQRQRNTCCPPNTQTRIQKQKPSKLPNYLTTSLPENRCDTYIKCVKVIPAVYLPGERHCVSSNVSNMLLK